MSPHEAYIRQWFARYSVMHRSTILRYSSSFLRRIGRWRGQQASPRIFAHLICCCLKRRQPLVFFDESSTREVEQWKLFFGLQRKENHCLPFWSAMMHMMKLGSWHASPGAATKNKIFSWQSAERQTSWLYSSSRRRSSTNSHRPCKNVYALVTEPPASSQSKEISRMKPWPESNGIALCACVRACVCGGTIIGLIGKG